MEAEHIARFRRTNHQAILGFLLPFVAAGSASCFVLYGRDDLFSQGFVVLFLTLIPLILVAGLVFSIRSIPRIKDRGDKDYAFSGLALNLFFIVIYVVAVVYCLFFL